MSEGLCLSIGEYDFILTNEEINQRRKALI